MDKSELRLLALRFANDDLDVMEYLQTRSALIDDITTGRREIQRIEVPDSAQRSEPGGQPSPPSRAKMQALPIALGGAASIVLIGAIVGYFSFANSPAAVPPGLTRPVTAIASKAVTGPPVGALGTEPETSEATKSLEDYPIAPGPTPSGDEFDARALPTAPLPDWFEAQPADSYTLQLFSSSAGNFSIRPCTVARGCWTPTRASSTVAVHGEGQNHPRSNGQRR